MYDNVKDRFDFFVNHVKECFERTAINTGIPSQLSVIELIGIYQAAASLVVAEAIDRNY